MVEVHEGHAPDAAGGDSPLASSEKTLSSVAVTIGKRVYAIGTLWLSSARSHVGAREARAWVAEQEALLPAYKSLFIVGGEGAEERTDIGICAIYKPGLHALAQVCAVHPEVFAAELPQDACSWGLVAETAGGTYLAVTSRDGLPLGERLVPLEQASSAKAELDAEFVDVHWMEPLSREAFETRLQLAVPGEPTAIARKAKTKQRVAQVAVLLSLAIGGLAVVHHYRSAERRLAALKAAMAAQLASQRPEGHEAEDVLMSCLRAFRHVGANALGWALTSAVCDTREASFVWRRTQGGLAATAPAGARVTADLRTAQITVPFTSVSCVPDGHSRYARIEAKLSDWAVREHERWGAGGSEHPMLSIEGIVPSWEIPARGCVRMVDVRWSHTGVWQMDMGW